MKFKTKENLSQYSRKKSYPISNVPYFCDKPNERFQLVYPHVYAKRFKVSFPLNFDLERDEKGYINYHVFLYAQDEFHGYNLRSQPKDICIQLKGGNHTGFGFASNVIVIPRALISAAIDNR